MKLNIAPNELSSIWSNSSLVDEELVEKIWELFGGDSDLLLSDSSSFPEELKNYIQMNFSRRSNIPLTDFEERMQKLAEIDKLKSSKQKLFFIQIGNFL